ncbi:MAG: archaeosortase/exosortase family protein [Chitinophagales bacterium]
MFQLFKDEKIAVPAKIVAVYLLWKLFYFFADQDGTALGIVWDKLVLSISTAYANATGAVLHMIGMRAKVETIYVYLTDSGKSIAVLEHCCAIPACVIFVACIATFKGTLTEKLWFIPLGLAGIVFINLTRLVFLCWVMANQPAAMFAMHHSVITVGFTYGLILLMIMWWMKRHTSNA